MDSDELLPNNLQTYLRSILPVESDVQMALREHTVEHPYSSMQISPEQGAFLAWIVRAFEVQSIIEVGVFTGYSTLCMAQALPESGRVIACDKNADWVAHGIPFWEQAGIRHKIDLRIGEGKDTLNELQQSGIALVDLVFIDADKPNYPIYYEQALTLLRPGGILILDNIFLMGRVVTDAPEKKTAKAIRALNKKIQDDPRVDPVILPFHDGLTLIRKL